MDSKAYIESGAIEAYVLGLATAEEIAALEQMRKQYPEVNEAINTFEMQMENVAMSEATAPPSFIKKQLNEELFGKDENNVTAGSGKVIAMQQTGMVKPFWKYLAAASIFFFALSSAMAVYFYDRYNSANIAYNDLFARTQTMQADNQLMNTKFNEMNESMKIIADPAVLSISMGDAPNKTGANMRATVYWDSKTKDVYLLSNNLPKAPAGKQYQLWAIVDGAPVDAGMMDECTGVCHMKNIPKAQAFAITLEEKGGKPKPEGEMYVLGKI